MTLADFIGHVVTVYTSGSHEYIGTLVDVQRSGARVSVTLEQSNGQRMVVVNPTSVQLGR